MAQRSVFASYGDGMFLARIPPDLKKRATIPHPSRASIFFLNPGIVECMKSKLGATVTYTLGDEEDTFTSSDGTYVEITRGQIWTDNVPFGTTVYNALIECVPPAVNLPEIQQKVANIEGRKAYRTMLGWTGPEGKELPEDVAKKIAKMSVSKKVDGGRKKTRGKKQSKRRQTRRR